MDLFQALGFHWERTSIPENLPRRSLEEVCFHFYRSLPEFVWDASVLEGNPFTVLEGNPFTFVEVKTLLDGITVGGRKVSDLEQVLNLADSSKLLLEWIKQREFVLDKEHFCRLHAIIARNEALFGHRARR